MRNCAINSPRHKHPRKRTEQLSKDVFADVCTGGNPREITEKDIMELYKIAY